RYRQQERELGGGEIHDREQHHLRGVARLEGRKRGRSSQHILSGVVAIDAEWNYTIRAPAAALCLRHTNGVARGQKKAPAGAGASYLHTHREGGLRVCKAEPLMERIIALRTVGDYRANLNYFVVM